MANFTIDYKIYAAEQINVNGTGVLLQVQTRNLAAHLYWRPNYFTDLDHIEFFAGSDGWQLLTSTGYRSYFLPHEDCRTEEDILSWFQQESYTVIPEDYQHQVAVF